MSSEPFDFRKPTAPKPLITELDRGELLVKYAQQMVVVFAVVLILFGGLRSLGQGLSDEVAEGNPIFKKFIFKSHTHHYATATADLLTGILYAVTAIGIFAREPWSKRLNFISVALYVSTTATLEMHEWLALDGNAFESFADTFFWSALPIIQVVMLCVGRNNIDRSAQQTDITQEH